MMRNTHRSDREAARQWARRMSQRVDRATVSEFDTWVLESPRRWRLFVLALVEYEVEMESAAAPRVEVVKLPVRTSALSDVYRPTRTDNDSRWDRLIRVTVGTIGVGLAAVALIALVTPAPNGGQRLVDTGSETLVVPLEDGSTITADPGSRFRVQFSDRERAVDFDRGNAVFEVKRDESRAFTVAFRGGSVESVGTRFRVGSENNQIEVDVYRGLVLIHSAQLGGDPVPLSVGRGVQISPEGLVTVVVRSPAVVSSDKPASASLREIEAAYNARHPDRPMSVDSEVQHDRVLLGVDETDPEDIPSALESLDRYDVERGPDRIVVKRRQREGARAPVKTER